MASGPAQLPPVEPSPDDLYVLYTGGTTGMPKGVLWRQHDIFMTSFGGRSLYTGELANTYDEIVKRCVEAPATKPMIQPPLMHGAAQWAAMTAMTTGQTVLFSSHVLAEVEQVCDRVCILQHGKLAHLQDMHDLRQGRLVKLRFSAPCDLPSLEGLKPRHSDDVEASFEYTGELSVLLRWLATAPLADVRMEPLGLAPIYFRYHGATA